MYVQLLYYVCTSKYTIYYKGVRKINGKIDTFTFRLDKEELENLQKLSDLLGVNKTEIINNLIQKKLKEVLNGKDNN